MDAIKNFNSNYNRHRIVLLETYVLTSAENTQRTVFKQGDFRKFVSTTIVYL